MRDDSGLQCNNRSFPGDCSEHLRREPQYILREHQLYTIQSLVLAYYLLVQQPLGLGRHVHLPHHAHQLADRLETGDLLAQVAYLCGFGVVELTALLLDAAELLEVVEQIVVDDLADLLVLGGVVDELLTVLPDHILELLQLLSLACLAGLSLAVEQFGRAAILDGVAEVDGHLLVAVLHLVHTVQSSHLVVLLRFCLRCWLRLLRRARFRTSLIVINLFFVLILESLDVLLLEVVAWLGLGRVVAVDFAVGVEVWSSFVDFRDNLQVRGDLVLGSGVELVLNDTEQPLIELEQRIDLVLMRLADLLQLLQFLLAGTLQFLQFLVLRPQLLHQNKQQPQQLTHRSSHSTSRVYQYKMRYNSLRSQLNWHSRQQTHIFKKLNRNEDRDRDSEKQEDLLKGNELIWLEKMMKELHQYKEETQEQDKTKKGKDPEQAEVIKEKSGRDGRGNVDRHQKIVVNLDEPGKSAKKIKFQIVINPDKPHSAKKIVNSEPKAKPKSVKKPVAKTTPKKSLGEKMSAGRESSASKEANSSKEIKVSCPSNTKVIDVQSMKTDPYTFSQANLQVLDELWKKEEKGSEPEPKLSSKKSVGKIIRNSDKLNKTCIEMPAKEIKPQLNISLNTINNSVQNTSYKQYKQSAGKQSASIHSFDSKELSSELKEQPSIVLSQQPYKEIKQQQSKIPQNNQKFKYQKIYIKLQTQKLSEYLTEKSQAKEENCSQKIKTNEYEKYCETKRNERPNPTLEQSLKKSLTNQKKEHETLTQKYKEEPAPRAKSQQRKFNKFAQIVRPAKLSDYEVARIKPAVKSIDQSIVFSTQTKEKQPENKIQIKLKRKYDYKDEQLPSKAQKLFTLHSVASDYSSNQEFREAKPPKVVTEEPSRPSLSTELQEETSLPTISQPSSITIPDSHIQSQQSLSESHFKESVVIKDFDPSKTDYTEQLTLLFNFLDEGQRGLLTDTNCHSDLLTQQLKLLFSVILNQIRTKKRFYNLQKFIEESKEILQIKNEVYNSNNRSVQVKNMVYQILKENIDILKKKLPLMFVKFSYTQSCFQTSNEQSKKNSVTEGQSFVIDKVHFDHTAPKKEIEDCIFSESFKDRSNDFVRLEVPDKNVINEIRLVQKGRRDKQNIEKYEVSYRKSTRKLEDTKTDLDMMQPQIYLQKKYGFGKGQAQECINTQKLSSMFLKTRGYLQNLDSYLKMR